MHLWLGALTRLYWSLVVLLCSATLLLPNRSACSLSVPSPKQHLNAADLSRLSPAAALQQSRGSVPAVAS